MKKNISITMEKGEAFAFLRGGLGLLLQSSQSDITPATDDRAQFNNFCLLKTLDTVAAELERAG